MASILVISLCTEHVRASASSLCSVVYTACIAGMRARTDRERKREKESEREGESCKEQ